MKERAGNLRLSLVVLLVYVPDVWSLHQYIEVLIDLQIRHLLVGQHVKQQHFCMRK